MPQISKNQIIYDHRDWLGGLHPQSGINGDILFNGAFSLSQFDPFRNLGYATPGYSADDATNSNLVDGVLKSGYLEDLAQVGYAIGGTKLHEITPSTGAIIDDDDFPHTLAGTTPVGSDVIEYYLDGSQFIFYTYNNAAGGQLGRHARLSSTFLDDYLTNGSYLNSTVMNGDVEHPMIIGADDNLYIADGRSLHQVNGGGGSPGVLTRDRFQVADGMTIVGCAKIAPRILVIFASSREAGATTIGRGEAYFWDYVKDDAEKVLTIPGGSINGAFEWNGTVGCWSAGVSYDPGSTLRTTNLILYDGEKFKVQQGIKESGNLPTHGGIEVDGQFVKSNINGNVYSLGSPFSGVKAGMQKLYKGDSTTSGMLDTFNTGKTLISSGTSTNGGLNVMDTIGYALGGIKTNNAEPLFSFGKRGTITRIRVEFKQASTGGRALKIDLNDGRNSATSRILDDEEDFTAGDLVKEFYTDTSGDELINFDVLNCQLLWQTGTDGTDAPIVRRVIVDFQEIEIN